MALYNTLEELLADARRNRLGGDNPIPGARYHALRMHATSPAGYVAVEGTDSNVLCFQSCTAYMTRYEYAVAIADYWNSLPTGAPVKDRSM